MGLLLHSFCAEGLYNTVTSCERMSGTEETLRPTDTELLRLDDDAWKSPGKPQNFAEVYGAILSYRSLRRCPLTLTELRESVPINIPDLAGAAGLDSQTIRNAESGQRISARSAKAIADALSSLLKRPVRAQEIERLKVRI